METIGVLIVEDQAMLRESLVSTIDSQPDMHVVASLADAAEAPAFVAGGGVDLALMDVCTENDSSGIVAAKRIKRDSPKVRVVIMTGMPDITFVEQARDAGVDSFVYKNVGISELLSVMRSTDSGYSGSAALTDEEIQILRLVCEAKSRKEIASELYMSEGTVKRRISEILAKTGYDNILRLAVHAVAEGSIVPRIGDK